MPHGVEMGRLPSFDDASQASDIGVQPSIVTAAIPPTQAPMTPRTWVTADARGAFLLSAHGKRTSLHRRLASLSRKPLEHVPGIFTILSPAKSLQMDGADEAACRFEATRPRFSAQTRALVGELRGRSSRSLEALMSISAPLAELNAERWQQFGRRANPRGAAAMCFRGDVYQGLEAWTLGKRSLDWAQDHVRILSGLYGLLRPLDTIQPYRLEMGTKLPTDAGKDLYAFWGERLSRTLKKDMAAAKADTLINLASDEYAKAARLRELELDVLDVKFLQKQGGEQKFISFYAKRARGLMARWMAENRPRSVSELAQFDLEGYRFRAKESGDGLMVFSRPRPAAASKKAG